MCWTSCTQRPVISPNISQTNVYQAVNKACPVQYYCHCITHTETLAVFCCSGGAEHLQVHKCHSTGINAAADVPPIPAQVPSGGPPCPGRRHGGHHRCRCGPPSWAASCCRNRCGECRPPGAGGHRGGTPFHHGDADPPDRGPAGEPCAGVDRRCIAHGSADSTAFTTSNCHGWLDIPVTALSISLGTIYYYISPILTRKLKYEVERLEGRAFFRRLSTCMQARRIGIYF